MKAIISSLLLKHPLRLLVVCSNYRSDMSTYNRGGRKILTDIFSDAEHNFATGLFPHKLHQDVNNVDVVCFKGCNQIYHLFTSIFTVAENKIPLHEIYDDVDAHLEFIQKQFPSAFLMFFEKVEGNVNNIDINSFLQKYNRQKPSNISTDTWINMIEITTHIINILSNRLIKYTFREYIFYRINANRPMATDLIKYDSLLY